LFSSARLSPLDCSIARCARALSHARGIVRFALGRVFAAQRAHSQRRFALVARRPLPVVDYMPWGGVAVRESSLLAVSAVLLCWCGSPGSRVRRPALLLPFLFSLLCLLLSPRCSALLPASRVCRQGTLPAGRMSAHAGRMLSARSTQKRVRRAAEQAGSRFLRLVDHGTVVVSLHSRAGAAHARAVQRQARRPAVRHDRRCCTEPHPFSPASAPLTWCLCSLAVPPVLHLHAAC
jgi:hypothetical protein